MCAGGRRGGGVCLILLAVAISLSHPHTHTRTHTLNLTYFEERTRAQARAHTHMQPRVRAHASARERVCVCVCPISPAVALSLSSTHARTNAHTREQTHKHAHTPTCKRAGARASLSQHRFSLAIQTHCKHFCSLLCPYIKSLGSVLEHSRASLAHMCVCVHGCARGHLYLCGHRSSLYRCACKGVQMRACRRRCST